jgi:hypothetical protein
MSRRSVLIIAAAGNGIVLCLSWVSYGWNEAGVHGAARNTARFSALWFLAGFAAPGLVRWIREWPAETDLLQAFVAAHLVHYGSVVAVLAFDPAHLLRHPIAAGVAIAGGFLLVLGLGLTGPPRASEAYGYLHRFLLYAVFLVFLVGLLNDRFRPFRVLAALLGLGLILRLTSGMNLASLQARTAGRDAAPR